MARLFQKMIPSTHQPNDMTRRPAAASKSFLGSSATWKPRNSSVQGNHWRKLKSRSFDLVGGHAKLLFHFARPERQVGRVSRRAEFKRGIIARPKGFAIGKEGQKMGSSPVAEAACDRPRREKRRSGASAANDGWISVFRK